MPAARSGRLRRATITGVYDNGYQQGGAGLPHRARPEQARGVNPRTWAALTGKGATPADEVRRRVGTPYAGCSARSTPLTGAGLTVNGVFEGRTTAAVKRYQADHKLSRTGVVTDPMWSKLQAALR